MASSSVVRPSPRTMPTPVSSHDVSMPSTITVTSVIGVPPHGVRVGPAGGVVALAQPDHGEPLAARRARARARCRCALRGRRRRAAASATASRSPQQRPADAAALVGGVDADRVHLGLVARDAEPGVPDERSRRPGRRRSGSPPASSSRNACSDQGSSPVKRMRSSSAQRGASDASSGPSATVTVTPSPACGHRAPVRRGGAGRAAPAAPARRPRGSRRRRRRPGRRASARPGRPRAGR